MIGKKIWNLLYHSYNTLKGEVCNSGSVRSQIVVDLRQRRTIPHNHVRCPNSVEPVDHQSTRTSLNAENHALTVLREGERGACGAVIVEEAVQTGSINDHVFSIQNAKTEGVAVSTETATIIGVIESGVSGVRTVGRVGIWLVVSARYLLKHKALKHLKDHSRCLCLYKPCNN
jgi:hypothetical protein